MSEELVMSMINNLNERMDNLYELIKLQSQRVDLLAEVINILKRNVFDEKEES